METTIWSAYATAAIDPKISKNGNQLLPSGVPSSRRNSGTIVPSFRKIVRCAIRVRCTVVIRPEARSQIYWTMVSIDTFGINRRDERFLAKDLSLREDTPALFSTNRYERPIAHSRGAVHPRVLECCQERTAMENELSRVVNAVATASLIENWIDG